MRKEIKVVLLVSIFILALAIGLNIPIMANGTQQDCNYSSGVCSTIKNYQSIMGRYYPCGYPDICSGNVKTVTLASAELYSGQLANSTSGATAHLFFSLNNPESITYITSLTLSSSGEFSTQVAREIFYNGTSEETVTSSSLLTSISNHGSNNMTVTFWDNDSQPSNSNSLINFNSRSSPYYENAIPSGTVTTFTYYPAVAYSTSFSTSEAIFPGQVYNYVITFANGQSISGSLIPISSNTTSSLNLSSSSSSSTSQPTDSFQLVSTNVIVHGMPAYLGSCIAFLVFCGTTPIQNYSLSVNLIKYNGTFYYERSMQAIEVPGNSAVGTGINASEIPGSQTSTYDAWFTNATVYCVTPATNGVQVCPT